MLRNTVNATIVRGGEKINVVPSEIVVELDGRMLPGLEPEQMIAEVQQIVGRDVELELVRHDPGPPSRTSDCSRCLPESCASSTPTGSRCRFSRSASPTRASSAASGSRATASCRCGCRTTSSGLQYIHAADRRVPADALEFGAEAVARGVQRFHEVLVLGGTKFLGRAFVEAALARGHELTLFNRGETNPDLFPEVEQAARRPRARSRPARGPQLGRRRRSVGLRSVCGARLGGAAARHQPVRLRLQHLRLRRLQRQSHERLRRARRGFVDELAEDYSNYGALKALCERAVCDVFRERSLIVRPADRRFARSDGTLHLLGAPARAGRRAARARPPEDRVQFIDVRDLAEWLVFCVERRVTGVFNATNEGVP